MFRIPQEPTLNQRFGILVHQVLERFHAGDSPSHSLPELLGLLEAGWRRGGFGDSEEEKQLRGKAEQALITYHERFQGDDAQPVEKALENAVGGLRVHLAPRSAEIEALKKRLEGVVSERGGEILLVAALPDGKEVELKLPQLTFQQTIRVRTRVTLEPVAGPSLVTRQVSFLAECYGEVARATSAQQAASEADLDLVFTEAAEVRRLGF